MDVMAKALHDACEPPDMRPTPEWAAEYLELSPGGYAIPGFFHVEKSRQLLEPLRALDDDLTRRVSVCAAVQGAKSLIPDVWIPRVLSDRPGPAMFVMQTEQIAKQHAEVRLIPNISGCKPLQRLLPDNRHKARTKEIIFKNGVPLYIFGPAISNAQSKSIRYLAIDEAWLIAANQPGRIFEFLNRTSKYDEIGNSKQLIISQGGDLKVDPDGKIIGDDWAIIWHEGSQELWTVPCLHCGFFFVPHFTINVPYPGGNAPTGYDDKAGMKWDANGEQVRYECPRCRQAMIDTDATKAQWNDRGLYTATNPAARNNRSFWWPKLISAKWEPLVQKFLRAMQSMKSGLILPLKEFVQKDDAGFWDERAHTTANEIAISTADYTPDPLKSWPDEKFRFMTVDCQANLLLFFVVIRAWSATGESRRLYRGHVESWEEVRKLQEKFGVPSKFVAVDCGYEATKVFRQCCRHVEEVSARGWTAFRESDSEWFIHHFKDRKERRIYSEVEFANAALGLSNPDMAKWLASVSPTASKLYQRGSLRCWVVTWSRPSVSDVLAGLRDGKGAPFLAPAADANDPEEAAYRRHMGSEIKKPKKDKGDKVERMQWVKVLRDNHYWSCEKMQVVCATIVGCIKVELPDESEKPAA